MSDPDLLSAFPAAGPPMTWRERLDAWAEALDLSLWRLLLGTIVLVAAGLLAWRLLAPSPPAPEMTLPFASTTVVPASSNTAEGHAAAPVAASDANQAGVASSTPAEVVIHVAGAVHKPGVQRLNAGARIVDAVEAAGGATADADLALVNLAAPVEDGQQVYLPRIGEEPPVPAGGGGAGATGTNGNGSGGAVHINTASAEELEQLPGVGPVIAEAIVAHRDQHGPFSSVDDLVAVRGIGDAKLEALRDHATV
jgi:competence protein ComEA